MSTWTECALLCCCISVALRQPLMARTFARINTIAPVGFWLFSPTKFHGVRASVLSTKHALTEFVFCLVVTGLVLQWGDKRSSGPELAHFVICAVFECCALICGAPYISWTSLHRPPGYCYWLMCAVAYRCWNSPHSLSKYELFQSYKSISSLLRVVCSFASSGLPSDCNSSLDNGSGGFDGICLAAFHPRGRDLHLWHPPAFPHSCCSSRHPRSAGEPGHVEDGVMAVTRGSRAVTAMMKMSALACRAWALHHAVNAYASLQVRPICWK